MWSVHKKTRQVPRRSSQTGKRSSSQNLGGKRLLSSALGGAAAGSVSKNTASQAVPIPPNSLNGSGAVSSTVSSSVATNPFLAAHNAKKAQETGFTGSSQFTIPSYASIVSGQAAPPQAVGGPVPSFITQGPGSMSPLAKHTSTSPEFASSVSQNPFLMQFQPDFDGPIMGGASSATMATGAPSFSLPSGSSAFNPFITASFPPPPPPSYQSTALSVHDANQTALVPPPYSATATDPQALPQSTDTTLHVKNIPDEFNTLSFLNAHFTKYGTVKEVKCHPNKKFATVQFKLREHAVLAKKSGRTLSQLYPPVSIFWHRAPASRRLTSDGPEAQPPSRTEPGAMAAPSASQPSAPSVATNTALHVKNIPEELNNSPFLRTHFSKFGFVKKVQCFPKRRCATILYAIREHAVKAKSQGKSLGPAHPPVQIFWHSGRLRVPSTSHDPAKPNTEAAATTSMRSHDPDKAVKLTSGSTAFLSQKPTDSRQPANQETPVVSFAQLSKKAQPQVVVGKSVLPTASKKGVLKSTAHVAKKGRVDTGSGKPSLPVRGQSLGTQQTVTAVPKNIWDRLGDKDDGVSPHDRSSGKAVKKRQRDDDAAWEPGEGGEGGDDDNEVDEGVSEGKDFLSELGNRESQTGGQEMDTIALFAPHGYNLRSLTQQQAYPSQLPPPPPTLPSISQAPPPVYAIPSLSLPPPPTPKSSSATDLCEALSLRDQEIRKGLVKQTSLAEATAIVGTCPDMCPEKERYDREDKRRLSYYEVLFQQFNERGNPRVDHCKAIKEYSGSAADKEEPLPHELRPPAVLCMTMDYLVSCVMGEGEGRWGDWYDFVWNRTRAIRKDITLQHLCNQECVELTEKCARFHILCSYVLCEEDINVFDGKLNNENLNKCLLSLKQFYRDLRTEKGELCPNEAEFCCYDILLHLSEGNVLNFVEEYSAHVRQRPQVQFAVDCALAFASNNFVKFFKLVRSASFLCACAMHRFFNTIRCDGLRVLNNAHSISKKSAAIPFPLGDIARMLAFESKSEAWEFCELLGLSTSGAHVELIKGGVASTAGNIVMKLCPQLINAKTSQSFGEIVNGGPVPPAPRHAPYCSFSGQTTAVFQPQEPVKPPEPVKPVYTEEDVSGAAEDICREVIDMEARTVTTESLIMAVQVEEEKQVYCAALWGDLLAWECREVAGESLAAARELYLAKEEASQRFCGEILAEVFAAEVEAVSREAYRDGQLDAEAMHSAVMATCGSMLLELVSTELTLIVNETVSQVKAEKRQQLEALKRRFLHLKLQKHWIRWRNSFQTRQHIRQSAADIPPLPPLVSVPRQLERLLPQGKRRKVECSLDASSLADSSSATSRQLEAGLLQRMKAKEELYSALDLPSLLRDELMASRSPTASPPSQPSHHHPPHIYWALSVLHPPLPHLQGSDKEALTWLFAKLSFRKPNTGGDLSSSGPVAIQRMSLSSTLLPPDPHLGQRRLNCVVKAVQFDGSVDVNDLAVRDMQTEVTGTSAAVFFVPLPPPECSAEDFSQRVFRQLTAFLSLLRPIPSIPVLVLASSGMERDHLTHWIQLKMDFKLFLQQYRIVSTVYFSTLELPSVSSSPSSSSSSSSSALGEGEEEGLVTGLQWLATHSPPQPQLHHTPLREHLEQGLLEHFVPLVLEESKLHRKHELLGHAHRPHPLIGLYNSVLEWLAAQVTSKKLLELSWPVVDFAPLHFSDQALPPPPHWNSHESFTALRDHISSVLLPPAPPPPSPAPHLGGRGGAWADQCAECLGYVARVSLPERSGSITLLSRVRALLKAHYLDFQKRTLFEVGQLQCSIPWDQVIFACVEHMLAHLDPDLWVCCYYGDQREFPLPSVWLRAQAETTLVRVAKASAHGKKRHRRHKSDSYLSTDQSFAATPVDGGRFQFSPTVGGTNIEKESHLLASSVQSEKALSQTFETQLQQWLEGQSSPSLEAHCHTSQHHPLPPSQHHPLPPSHQHSEPSHWSGSLEDGIQLLKMKIHTTRWQNSTDSDYFECLEQRDPR